MFLLKLKLIKIYIWKLNKNYCSNNKNNNNFKFEYIDKEIFNKKVFLSYKDLVNFELSSPEEQRKIWCVHTETDYFHNYILANFHGGFLKYLRNNNEIIYIKSNHNNIKFNEKDINFIKSNDEQYWNFNFSEKYPKNILTTKQKIYKELKQISKLKNLDFLLIIPKLDDNNYFYYELLIGIKKINYKKIIDLKFTSIKNLNFINLKEDLLTFDFFHNLFTFNKNIFINEDYRKIYDLYLNKVNEPTNNFRKYYYYSILYTKLFFLNQNMYFYLGSVIESIDNAENFKIFNYKLNILLMFKYKKNKKFLI